jgi:NUMOD3 motif-containing protein
MTEKYGFVYIWYDRKHRRYYVGCHWGREDDGYICSSPWMQKAYRRRSGDFKRRILIRGIASRKELYVEEQRWLNMIKPQEIKVRYYNLNTKNNKLWHSYDENIKTIGQKISVAKKGKPGHPLSLEHRQKLIESNKNRIVSDETRLKMSLAKQGKPSSMRGRNLSNEAKYKISFSSKGRAQTQETRNRRSLTMGTLRWCTDGSTNVRIRSNISVPVGFRLGRTWSRSNACRV